MLPAIKEHVFNVTFVRILEIYLISNFTSTGQFWSDFAVFLLHHLWTPSLHITVCWILFWLLIWYNILIVCLLHVNLFMELTQIQQTITLWTKNYKAFFEKLWQIIWYKCLVILSKPGVIFKTHLSTKCFFHSITLF